MRIRDLLAGLGVAAGVVGLGVALSPGIAAGIDLLSVIPVQFVGFAAVALTIVGYLARRRAVFARADPPAVEDLPAFGRPGADVDVALESATGAHWLGHTHRRDLRERLFDVAVEVLMTTEGCDRDAAVTMLREGTWTDDRRALALFATDPPSTPVQDVVIGLVSGRTQFSVQASHVIAVLWDRLEGQS